MKYFAGLLAIVALVAAATFGGYRAWDKATHTRDDNGGVLAGSSPATLPAGTPAPAEGSVVVIGTLTGAHLEGAALQTLPTPFTVTTSERGVGGATITPVVVGGQTTSIDWQAGQPFPLAGDGGSLLLGPVTVDVSGDGIALGLDGVHGFTPGAYQINTSVAVGSQPRDSVTFTANDKTTVEFRGGATTAFGGPALTTDGTGAVTLTGKLTVTNPNRSTTSVETITLDSGIYHIALAAADGGGYTVQATLQGPTH